MNQSVNIRQALLHMFDDPEWVSKSLIGGLVSLVLGLNLAAVGYQVRTTRKVWRGEEPPMPRWDDFGGMFTEGLRLGLARYIISLPILLLVMVPAVAFAFIVPLAPLLAGSEAEVEQWLTGALGIGLVGGGLSCGLAVLIGLVLSFVWPAMDANYTRHGTFAACFDVKEIARFIRENGKDYLLVWAAGLGAGFALYLVLMFAYFIPCIGPLAAIPVSAWGIFYVQMVTGHGAGQLLRLDEARRAAPAALAVV